MSTPKVLGGGYDTSCYTMECRFENFDKEYFERLHEDTKRAKAKWEGFRIEDDEYRLLPYKGQGYFIFHNDYLRIQINPDLNPSLKVQYNAQGVYEAGYQALDNAVKRALEFFGASELEVDKGKLYRQDFHIDVQVDKINIKPENVMARGKTMTVQDPHLDIETIAVGKRGKETVFTRIYDKRTEIAHTRAYWNLGVLKGYEGYDPDKDTLRIEFELGGHWLAKYDMREVGALRADTGAIPKYLVNTHISLIEPFDRNDNHNRMRDKKLIPIWSAVQEYINSTYYGDLWFHRKPDPQYEFIVRKQNYLRMAQCAFFNLFALHAAHDLPYSHQQFSEELRESIMYYLKADEEILKRVRQFKNSSHAIDGT